jgi:hypothetical protein
MRLWSGIKRASTAAVVLSMLTAVSCSSILSVKYEYDEEVYLDLDGSATIYVNASVPALVALRGAPLDVDPRARLDRNDVRAFFASPVTEVVSVTTSRRDNRRYVHVRVDVDDLRRLHEAPAFAWSRYSLESQDAVTVFRQQIGASAGRDVGDVGWSGSELTAFRMHLPSRVPFHNAPSREVERGNIIRWEQPLAARMRGEPITMEVHLENESILAQTLSLFALTATAALAALGLAVWMVMRRKGAELPVPADVRPADVRPTDVRPTDLRAADVRATDVRATETQSTQR